MKKILTFAAVAVFVSFTIQACAQGSPKDTPEQKLHRASLGSVMKQTINTGATITITYSQPALKGRTIGKDVEPMAGKVWRTGANEATSFEVSKDVTIEGKKLSAGKYGLYSIMNGNDWTIIINKTWDTWGAFSYKQSDDVLRVNVKSTKSCVYMERMVFTIDKMGKVSLLWGDTEVDFHVQ
ncbi:MAG TPA: DUF2911 domain-containing protein [Chitinophagaceae bacterium]|nr:DUF2911 domain-containing protein [Chitinophagaceae bacterium]